MRFLSELVERTVAPVAEVRRFKDRQAPTDELVVADAAGAVEERTPRLQPQMRFIGLAIREMRRAEKNRPKRQLVPQTGVADVSDVGPKAVGKTSVLADGIIVVGKNRRLAGVDEQIEVTVISLAHTGGKLM